MVLSTLAVTLLFLLDVGLIDCPEDEWTIVVILNKSAVKAPQSEDQMLVLTLKSTFSDAYHHRPKMMRPPGSTTPS
jgi:hypothetical protein